MIYVSLVLLLIVYLVHLSLTQPTQVSKSSSLYLYHLTLSLSLYIEPPPVTGLYVDVIYNSTGTFATLTWEVC